MTAAAVRYTPESADREEFQAKAAGQASALEARVRAIKAASVDAKADTRTFTMVPITEVIDAASVDLGTLAPKHRVALTVPGQGLRLAIAENAHDQIAARVDIPRAYYEKMLTEAPDLLATNVNRWFNQNPSTRLVRILKPTTPEEATFMDSFEGFGTVRGFLSGSYRPLDNPELLASVLPIAQEHGAYLRDFSLDDQRLHARFATFERSAQSIVKAVAERNGITEAQAMNHTRQRSRRDLRERDDPRGLLHPEQRDGLRHTRRGRVHRDPEVPQRADRSGAGEGEACRWQAHGRRDGVRLGERADAAARQRHGVQPRAGRRHRHARRAGDGPERRDDHQRQGDHRGVAGAAV
jgi:hypothetical protein